MRVMSVIQKEMKEVKFQSATRPPARVVGDRMHPGRRVRVRVVLRMREKLFLQEDQEEKEKLKEKQIKNQKERIEKLKENQIKQKRKGKLKENQKENLKKNISNNKMSESNKLDAVEKRIIKDILKEEKRLAQMRKNMEKVRKTKIM